MEKTVDQIKKKIVSGLVLLLPILVFLVLFKKFWGFFENYGNKFAKLLSLDDLLGDIAKDLLGGIFLLLLVYLSGYLVSLSFFRNFSNWIDEKLMIFVPGYEQQKKLAEEKLIGQAKKDSLEEPMPILFKVGEYWQPAYLIEENQDGRVVVFVPIPPAKENGQIYVATTKEIKKLKETKIHSFDTAIKDLGKGILDFK
ncbi:DUF502 domain-containing protein [Flavobacterium gilvum]|uniref:DUF502 domain-containing protein n=1 Tax=Flavobacterium gilvum TaxID=1492737 RepID=A0AAC9I5N8_9FLAO|nr:hypothetical protein [Flavobacterium gilvum]AOW10057.1 hypothetical protein EM308_11355 [Flavobacterium gilvum]KFC58676.1 hypothetical protein FEM08_25390 [Flavobacterium gilvum]